MKAIIGERTSGNPPSLGLSIWDDRLWEFRLDSSDVLVYRCWEITHAEFIGLLIWMIGRRVLPQTIDFSGREQREVPLEDMDVSQMARLPEGDLRV